MIEINAFQAAAGALASALESKAVNPAAIASSVPDPATKAALAELLTPKSAGPTLAVGGTLGEFKLEKQLSAPNRPPTWKASRSGHDYVLKAIPGASATERARSVLGQLLAAQADSPSLAKPQGFLVEGGFAFVVRPFVEGVTLAAILAILAKEDVPPDSPTWRLAAGARGGGANVTGAKMVCRIGQHVAEALVALNAKRAIHGAIKPENLVCDDTVKPVLVDAGLGTAIPPYEAPEVIAAGAASDRDARAAARDPHSDLYALGVLMHACLTRQPLFPDAGSDAAALERATAKEKPVSPLKVNFKASNEMTTITLALLEKDPKKRYGSAAELKADLDRYHTNEPIERKGPGLFSKLFG